MTRRTRPIIIDAKQAQDGTWGDHDHQPTTHLPGSGRRRAIPGDAPRRPVSAAAPTGRRLSWQQVKNVGVPYKATIWFFAIAAILLLPGVISYNYITGSPSCSAPVAITPSAKVPTGQKVTYGREQYTSSAYDSIIAGNCAANDGLRQLQSAWSWSPTDSQSSLNAKVRSLVTAFGGSLGILMVIWLAVRGVHLWNVRAKWIGVRGHPESRDQLEHEDRIKRKPRSDSVPIRHRVFVFVPVAAALAVSLLFSANPSSFNLLNYAQYPSRAVTWLATFGGDHQFENFQDSVTNTENDAFSASLLGAQTPEQQAADRDHVSQYLSGSYSTLQQSQAYQARFNANVKNSQMNRVATGEKTYGKALQVESAIFGGSIEFWRFILLATTIIGGLLLLFVSALGTIRLPGVTLVYGTIGAFRYLKRWLLVAGCAAAFLFANAMTQSIMVHLTTFFAHHNLTAGSQMPIIGLWINWVQWFMWGAIIVAPFLYVLITYLTIKFCLRLIRRSLDARIYEHEQMEPMRMVRLTRIFDDGLDRIDSLLSHRTIVAIAKRDFAQIGAPPKRRAITGRRYS